MAYQLFTVFNHAFTDSDGVPLENGWVQSFLAGTSTPTPTYSSITGTSRGTSFALDSQGRIPSGGLFGDQAVAYKFLVWDGVLDNTSLSVAQPQYTQDNVTFVLQEEAQAGFPPLQRARTTVTGTQNNYDLDAAATSDQEYISWWEWNGASDLNLTGLQGGEDGRQRYLENITASAIITVSHQSGSSSAANRFYTSTALPLFVRPGQLLFMRYDGADGFWHCQVLAPTVPLAGASVAGAVPRGLIAQSISPVPTVGTGEDTLITFTIPANVLSENGARLVGEFSGTSAANADNRTVKLHFGATAFFTSGVYNLNALQAWKVIFTVMRLTATTQRCTAAFWTAGGGLSAYFTANTTAAETLSGAVVLKCTGEAVSNGDIVNTDAYVDWVGVS